MEEVAIDKLKPYPKNAKKHPEEQVRKIADSIEAFGFVQPIVVDKHFVIIIGHGRYFAAKLLDYETVPVIVKDLSEKHANALRLADNRLNQLSDFDMDLVIDELKDLEDEALIALTGFEKDIMEFNPTEGGQGKLDESEPKVCPHCGMEL